jgi:hypothetical protein
MSEDDRKTPGDPGITVGNGGVTVPNRLDLRNLLSRQYTLQVNSYKVDPGVLRGEDRGLYVTQMSTALLHELVEAMNEIAWKPWSIDKDTFNRRAYLKELADLFHFFENLLLVALQNGQSASALAVEFADLYFDKADVNKNRMATGTYDGFSTKCPDCGRAIEDGERTPFGDKVILDIETEQAYLCQCGRMNYLVKS